ncbi:MAG: sulfotransferase [Acidimicrobiia bacterium]|nr:sulfotransferase [Acidimicrobiia bacterium]
MKPEPLALDVEAARASALFDRAIFVLATPETGAERLLRALGALPGVAAAPVPTHLFSQGIGRLLDHWRLDPGPQALSGLADAGDFLLAVRLLADAPLAALAKAQGAEWVVEYSPRHPAHATEIAGLYPDARLVHLVRDGRQVAARLSSPVYGRPARYAARQWIDDQRAVADLEHEHLFVVRIEDLLAEPEGVLVELVAALGIGDPPLAVAADAVGRPRDLPAAMPGRAGAIVETVAYDLLAHFDYPAGGIGRSSRAAAWAEMLAASSAGVAGRLATETGSRAVGRARSFVRSIAEPRRGGDG